MRSQVMVVALVGVLAILPAVALAADPAQEAFALAQGLPVSAPQPVQDGLAAAQNAAGPVTGAAPPALPPVTEPLRAVTGGFPVFAVAGLALAGLGAVAGALFMGGARFVTPAEVLENDVRAGIYSYLKTSVGANLKQVTDDLHLTTTNAIWHLRKLEEAGLIHSKRFNGYKVFYPAEGGVEARRLSLGKTALANANAQEVFEHVVAHPGTHQREIARALGVNHGTVRWHLKKLMDAELIVETRRGKASAYEPTPMGLQALHRVQQAPAAPAPAVEAGFAA
jgi:predicted transcriptional regulator